MKKMKKGQTMVEYIIIVALIAISLIAVFSYFSKGVGNVTVKATEKLDSQAGSEARSAADKLGGENQIKNL